MSPRCVSTTGLPTGARKKPFGISWPWTRITGLHRGQAPALRYLPTVLPACLQPHFLPVRSTVSPVGREAGIGGEEKWMGRGREGLSQLRQPPKKCSAHHYATTPSPFHRFHPPPILLTSPTPVFPLYFVSSHSAQFTLRTPPPPTSLRWIRSGSHHLGHSLMLAVVHPGPTCSIQPN